VPTVGAPGPPAGLRYHRAPPAVPGNPSETPAEVEMIEHTTGQRGDSQSADALLACPACRADAPLRSSGDALTCPACGTTLPVRAGVVVAAPDGGDRDTKAKFEHQWAVWGADDVIFGKSTEQYEERYFAEFAGPALTREWFAGKTVLDAGCGHGIMVEVFRRLGAQSVGLELGDGVVQAARRLQGTDARLVQGDILAAPFRDAAFDYVYSNGVIHHTRDPRRAFAELARIVKPGGHLDLWLYPRRGRLWETIMPAARAVTVRLPPAVLSRLVYLLVPLLYVVPTWSRTSPRTHTWRQCAQVIYDWLSPRYQSHHDFDEVRRWYEEEGFVDVGQRSTTPLTTYGTKR
jgi:SAM-dependent methyltransferase